MAQAFTRISSSLLALGTASPDWLTPQPLMRRFASQLGHPQGLMGRAVLKILEQANAEHVTAAVDALGVVEGRTVADIGFGSGLGLRLMLDRVGPDGSVVGIDFSTISVDRARRRFRREIAAGKLHLHQAPIDRMLTLVDNSLDGVVTANTIYYLPDPTAGLREVRRVLRPTGRVVLGVGDPDFMATLPFTKEGVQLRPLPEIVSIVRDAGFDVVDHRRIGDSPKIFHLLVLASTTSEDAGPPNSVAGSR